MTLAHYTAVPIMTCSPALRRVLRRDVFLASLERDIALAGVGDSRVSGQGASGVDLLATLDYGFAAWSGGTSHSIWRYGSATRAHFGNFATNTLGFQTTTAYTIAEMPPRWRTNGPRQLRSGATTQGIGYCIHPDGIGLVRPHNRTIEPGLLSAGTYACDVMCLTQTDPIPGTQLTGRLRRHNLIGPEWNIAASQTITIDTPGLNAPKGVAHVFTFGGLSLGDFPRATLAIQANIDGAGTGTIVAAGRLRGEGVEPRGLRVESLSDGGYQTTSFAGNHGSCKWIVDAMGTPIMALVYCDINDFYSGAGVSAATYEARLRDSLLPWIQSYLGIPYVVLIAGLWHQASGANWSTSKDEQFVQHAAVHQRVAEDLRDSVLAFNLARAMHARGMTRANEDLSATTDAGVWADATAYAANARVTIPNGGRTWRCVVPHTSDLALNHPVSGTNYLSFWKEMVLMVDNAHNRDVGANIVGSAIVDSLTNFFVPEGGAQRGPYYHA
ncbi:MAG TPA: hypothetical protein PKC43_06225 [Phycisphaerales bacterium]|nr:hypothetical protein [Phycisphaerales bacterium]HMP37028.1 hypothetical protein [Phycisphaerales bacterium]